MDIGNTVTDYLANSIGKVEKAVIKVVDDGNGKGEDGVRLEDAVCKSIPLGQFESAYRISKNVQNDAIKDLAKLHVDVEQQFATGKQFTVQFNPATLRLRAAGGGQTEIQNFIKGEDEKAAIGISYQPIPFSIHMDVDLIFNKVNPNDAFIEIGQSPATIKGAANTVSNLLGKNSTYSIQNEVEGLIAMTRCFTTCVMSFNWGKLCYSGVLQQLDANYSMFNPKGEPIAGTVHLSMILIDEGVNERNSGKWYKAYQEAFSEQTSLSSAESLLGGSAFSNFTF